MPVVDQCPHAELPSNVGIGRSETVPTTTGRTDCIRLSYMSGGRELQSLIHLRLTKAYARCSGVHSYYLVKVALPRRAVPATGTVIPDQVSEIYTISKGHTHSVQVNASVGGKDACPGHSREKSLCFRGDEVCPSKHKY